MKFKTLTGRRGIVMRPLWPFARTARGWRSSRGGGWILGADRMQGAQAPLRVDLKEINTPILM